MSSSAPRPRSCGDVGGEEGKKDDGISKAAGFVVFSGIALNIIKALTPKPQEHQLPPQAASEPSPPPQAVSQPSPPPPLPDSALSLSAREEVGGSVTAPLRAPQTIEIVQGDTLWGLSRKYGVPISEIKKANGLTGDTIYAGKKLVIP